MSGNSFIIGISGGSGSGKTSFIRDLRARFDESQLCILSQDDYYKPREEQVLDANNVKNFDLPTSILSDKLVNDLETLIAGESVHLIEYVFNNAQATPKKLTITPAKIIVVEGLFIYHFDALREKFDLKIFVHAEDEIKLDRRIRRDQIERNYPKEDVVYRYENHVLPSYRKFIEPYKSECQLVVNNNQDYQIALDMLTQYVKHFLV